MTTIKTTQQHKYFRLSLEMLQVGFSVNHTALHGYMLNRFIFFKQQNQEYFESQEILADALQISKRTVATLLSDLQEKEYIKALLVRKGKSFINVYTVYDKHNIYDVKATSTKKIKLLTEEVDEPF